MRATGPTKELFVPTLTKLKTKLSELHLDQDMIPKTPILTGFRAIFYEGRSKLTLIF